MKRFLVFATLFLYFSLITAQVNDITKKEIIDYGIRISDEGWRNYKKTIKDWADKIDIKSIWGYRPPSNIIYQAAVNGLLYKKTEEEKYGERAAKILKEYGLLKRYYPDDYYKTRADYSEGLPTLPNFFTASIYIRAYDLIKEKNFLSVEDKRKIESWIAESANYYVNFQEWGAMNRSMLRAEAFLYAYKVVPYHPDAQKWKMMAKSISNDSWGEWSIEDASGYNAIWLYSLTRYAEIKEDMSLYDTIQMRYYYQYFLNLISPAGLVPDFGDSYWRSGWDRFTAFFLKGAKMYKNPHYKWAALRMFNKVYDLDEGNSPWIAYLLLDCYDYIDEDMKAQQPENVTSRQVLDDFVGKKVVFRNGFEKNSTYMLINYKDEGDGGWIDKENMRTSIAVEEEKMHHGHSDENSICLFMKNGAVLLHDGGYRDYMPSGPYGAYRQDYFHNRIVVRKNKIFKGQKKGEFRYSTGGEPVKGQKLLEFIRNSGNYRKTETYLIDFLNLRQGDYSRSRVIDDKIGYQQDRIVNYIKELDIFVVVDVIKFIKSDYYTAANLWHTRKILNSGPGYYDTEIDSLRNISVENDMALLIYFPERNGKMEGVENEKRYWQDEKVIYQFLSRHFYTKEVGYFVTVLIPHKKGEDIKKLLEKVEMMDIDRKGKAVAVRIIADDKTYCVYTKLDLKMDIYNSDKRPMYNYESGKVNFGDFESDCSQFFAIIDEEKIDFTAVNATKLLYKGDVLFEQNPIPFGLSFDGTEDKPKVGKLRYWADVYEIK